MYTLGGSSNGRISQSQVYDQITFACEPRVRMGIVLNAVCDLEVRTGSSGLPAPPKAQYILLVGVWKLGALWRAFVEAKLGIDTVTYDRMYTQAGTMDLKKRTDFNTNTLRRFLNVVLSTTEGPRYYPLVLRDDPTDEPFVVDYQLVTTARPETITSLPLVATLKDWWSVDVPARYAAYQLRVGTDEYSWKPIIDRFTEEYSLK